MCPPPPYILKRLLSTRHHHHPTRRLSSVVAVVSSFLAFLSLPSASVADAFHFVFCLLILAREGLYTCACAGVRSFPWRCFFCSLLPCPLLFIFINATLYADAVSSLAAPFSFLLLRNSYLTRPPCSFSHTHPSARVWCVYRAPSLYAFSRPSCLHLSVSLCVCACASCVCVWFT